MPLQWPRPRLLRAAVACNPSLLSTTPAQAINAPAQALNAPAQALNAPPQAAVGTYDHIVSGGFEIGAVVGLDTCQPWSVRHATSSCSAVRFRAATERGGDSEDRGVFRGKATRWLCSSRQNGHGLRFPGGVTLQLGGSGDPGSTDVLLPPYVGVRSSWLVATSTCGCLASVWRALHNFAVARRTCSIFSVAGGKNSKET